MAKKPAKQEPEEEPKRLLFDSTHGEVDIVSDSFKLLRNELKKHQYEVYKLSQSPITSDLIEEYTIFVIAGPSNNRFTEEEVTELMGYLREGGAIIIASRPGGDAYNNTNLNDITKHLGYEFNSDYLAHETDFDSDDYYLTISKGVSLDPLTMGVRSIYTGKTSTVKINDPSGAKSLVFSHEPWPESRHLIVYGYYQLGRHLGIGGLDFLEKVHMLDNTFLLMSTLYYLSSLRTEQDFL